MMSIFDIFRVRRSQIKDKITLSLHAHDIYERTRSMQVLEFTVIHPSCEICKSQQSSDVYNSCVLPSGTLNLGMVRMEMVARKADVI